MMTGMYKAFSKKMLGARYEQIFKSIFVFLIIIFALSNWDIELPVGFHVIALTSFMFTFGIMIQTLNSDENASYLKGQFMLPISRAFVYEYIGIVMAYTIISKSAILLAVLLSLTQVGTWEIVCFIISALNAGLTGAYIYAQSKKHAFATIVLLILQVGICFIGLFSKPIYCLVSLLSIFILGFGVSRTDPYLFLKNIKSRGNKIRKSMAGRLGAISAFVARYFAAYKSYLANTLLVWVFGCAFAGILGSMGFPELFPMGLALLSLNTVLGTIISTDKSTYRKLLLLPNQVANFAIPLGIPVFLSTLLGYTLFFMTWTFLIGSVPLVMYPISFAFAMQTTILTVFIDWKFPLTKWKVESDVLHHPRKYIVPVILILEAMLLIVI